MRAASTIVAGVLRGMREGSKARLTLLATSCAALCALCVIFGIVTVQARRDVKSGIEASAQNLASAVAHDVDRNIELLDLSLQAVVEAWANPAIRGLDPSLRQRVMFDHSATAQDTGIMLVLDENGIVRADSQKPLPRPDSFEDRDYFRVHVGNDGLGLFVSKPFVSRLSGAWMIALTRRINKPDGSFGGVAVATLQLSYLDKLYAGLNLGRGGSITLVKTDGTIVTRSPYVQSDINLNVRNSDAFTRIRAANIGSIQGESPIDGRDRLISFHRIGKLPLIQVVELSADEAYAAWWRKTLIVGGILGLLCLSSMSLLILLNSELSRRVKIEAILARLAMTDGLTEIANRRRFDEALHAEWQRAIRERTELCLLMIDADHFKAFNDAFGHVSGDDLLRSFAHCIAGNVHRPGDLAARYGGEEFAVLLPNTNGAGAMAVAELIRAAITGLAIINPASSIQRATVSIGVACTRPQQGQSSSQFVANADAALYRAKSDGRNCCRLETRRGIRLVAA